VTVVMQGRYEAEERSEEEKADRLEVMMDDLFAELGAEVAAAAERITYAEARMDEADREAGRA
jgi:hypothetical protein